MHGSGILRQAALAGFLALACLVFGGGSPRERADHRLHGRQSRTEYDDRNLQ